MEGRSTEQPIEREPKKGKKWLSVGIAVVAIVVVAAVVVLATRPNNGGEESAKFRVSIDSYEALYPDWNWADVQFKILIDVDNDGVWDQIYESDTFYGGPGAQSSFDRPYNITCDVPEEPTYARLSVLVMDTYSDEPIDYTPDAYSTSYSWYVWTDDTGSWTYDGSDDLAEERDCRISITAGPTG